MYPAKACLLYALYTHWKNSDCTSRDVVALPQPTECYLRVLWVISEWSPSDLQVISECAQSLPRVCSCSAHTIVLNDKPAYIWKGLFCPYTLPHFPATSTVLFVWFVHELRVCDEGRVKISKSGCLLWSSSGASSLQELLVELTTGKTQNRLHSFSISSFWLSIVSWILQPNLI